MDYDFRNRVAPAHDSLYGRTSGAHVSNFYPRIGQSVPPVARVSSFQQASSFSPGSGIRVAIKPEYRITPPPQLVPVVADVPRSNFSFDFDFERKILAEAEKESQNWSRIAENHAPKTTESASSLVSATSGDPVVNKYVASGLGREAVSLAVANYGDNPSKVREFVNGYNLLREMGFSSKNVAEVLATYDNDTDKALAHFLNGGS